jgi:hypothetical protein
VAIDLSADPANFELHIEDGLWKFSFRPHGPDASKPGRSKSKGRTDVGPIWIGTAIGPKGLTRNEAMEIIRNIFPSPLGWEKGLTVAEFVVGKFVPMYVVSRSISSRIYYRSILKHIIDPKVVDQAFGNEGAREGARGRFVSGWPYLGSLRLEDVQPESVKNLITAAFNHGYSIHTVSHIRDVVCTIFSFAARERDFEGDNPARLFKWLNLRHTSHA